MRKFAIEQNIHSTGFQAAYALSHNQGPKLDIRSNGLLRLTYLHWHTPLSAVGHAILPLPRSPGTRRRAPTFDLPPDYDRRVRWQSCGAPVRQTTLLDVLCLMSDVALLWPVAQMRNLSDALGRLARSGALQIVALLQIQLEIGTIAAQLPAPQCHDWRLRLFFLQNVIERLTRYAEQLGDLRLGPIKRRQNLLA